MAKCLMAIVKIKEQFNVLLRTWYPCLRDELLGSLSGLRRVNLLVLLEAVDDTRMNRVLPRTLASIPAGDGLHGKGVQGDVFHDILLFFPTK